MGSAHEIEILEGLLEVMVEAGNVEQARGIMDTLCSFYSSSVEHLDSLNGQALGHQLNFENSDLSAYDLLREGYRLSAEKYDGESDFYCKCVEDARRNGEYD